MANKDRGLRVKLAQEATFCDGVEHRECVGKGESEVDVSSLFSGKLYRKPFILKGKS
jgi:hypothetical protein